jgi:flavodoxin
VKSIVIYGSRYGNTHEIAKAIAISLERWGSVELFAAETAPSLKEADLVVVGGPTEAHGMSEPLKQFFAGLEGDSMRGKLAACFDTRLTWPRLLSGSAAARIDDKLRGLGAEVIVPDGSFLVSGKTPVLEPGEQERAVAWAEDVARTAAARMPVGATKP